jgi:16S rRNA (guanine(966)-N(2))-methyltransferase RsmD
MRIIAGSHRGWKIEPPKGYDVSRPITDRVKEALFNILQFDVPGRTVLDLFAGVGSMGLEALSRDAKWVTFVEQDRDVAEALRRNIERCKFEKSSRILQSNVLKLREGIRDTARRELPDLLTYDIVFVDPPYRLMKDELTRAMIGETLAQLSTWNALAENVIITVRHDSRDHFAYDWPGFAVTDSRRWGSMTIDFFSRAVM